LARRRYVISRVQKAADWSKWKQGDQVQQKQFRVASHNRGLRQSEQHATADETEEQEESAVQESVQRVQINLEAGSGVQKDQCREPHRAPDQYADNGAARIRVMTFASGSLFCLFRPLLGLFRPSFGNSLLHSSPSLCFDAHPRPKRRISRSSYPQSPQYTTCPSRLTRRVSALEPPGAGCLSRPGLIPDVMHPLRQVAGKVSMTIP